MVNRLFKEGIITTILGLIIILAAVFTWVFTEKHATEVVTIAGIGTGLLFLKDKHVLINRKNDSDEKN